MTKKEDKEAEKKHKAEHQIYKSGDKYHCVECGTEVNWGDNCPQCKVNIDWKMVAEQTRLR